MCAGFASFFWTLTWGENIAWREIKPQVRSTDGEPFASAHGELWGTAVGPPFPPKKRKRMGHPAMSYNDPMFARNSLLERALPSLSISSSMASTGESGLRILRSTQMRARSSLGISSSSLRVPER
jgi:hypothetical protein